MQVDSYYRQQCKGCKKITLMEYLGMQEVDNGKFEQLYTCGECHNTFLYELYPSRINRVFPKNETQI